MNQIATSPDNARFWVRPYEFEGDGSHGAAEDVASLEVGGKTRTFWLKTLENRLFFREIGRDENWNFGALDELSETEKLDLPSALARVLANESYGRVVLPRDVQRPCLFLATRDERALLLAPGCSLRAQGAWMPQNSARARPFLDRSPGVFESLNLKKCRGQLTIDQAFAEIYQLPIRVIRCRWLRGTQPEWERVVKAFFHLWWTHFHAALEADEPIQWELQSAWAMQAPQFYLKKPLYHGFYRSDFQWSLESRADFLRTQFLFVGQGKEIKYLGMDITGACALHGIVSQPTHHEILEAHLFLRDWINQKLPSAKAKKWLDFL